MTAIADFKRINPKTLPNILRRLKAIRIAIKGDGPGAQAAFAKESGIQAPNWNMYERHRYGQRIGVDAAMKLVEKWDVTLDYIYYGRRHGVEQPLWEDLQAAEKYVIEQEGRGDCEEEAKRASPTADLVPERASIADESNKGVGERIVLIRTRLHNNVTQEDFADTHGFTRSAVSLWETGARRPKPPDATTIARYYGVSLDWIYTGEIGNLKVEVRERLLRTKAKP